MQAFNRTIFWKYSSFIRYENTAGHIPDIGLEPQTSSPSVETPANVLDFDHSN